MQSKDSNADAQIQSRLVPAVERLLVLPRHFGARALILEVTVFKWADRLVPRYNGGYWQFYELTNGGFYMTPRMNPTKVRVASNGFEGVMRAEAIGITVCLFAINECCDLLSGESQKTFVDHYHWLLDFAKRHPEHQLIMAATD